MLIICKSASLRRREFRKRLGASAHREEFPTVRLFIILVLDQAVWPTIIPAARSLTGIGQKRNNARHRGRDEIQNLTRCVLFAFVSSIQRPFTGDPLGRVGFYDFLFP